MKQARQRHSFHGENPAEPGKREEEAETIPVGLIFLVLLVIGCALFLGSTLGSGWFADVAQETDRGVQEVMDRLRQDPRNLPLRR